MCCGDISKEVITSYEFTWSEIGTQIKTFKLTKRNCISMWISIYIIGIRLITSENKKAKECDIKDNSYARKINLFVFKKGEDNNLR